MSFRNCLGYIADTATAVVASYYTDSHFAVEYQYHIEHAAATTADATINTAHSASKLH